MRNHTISCILLVVSDTTILCIDYQDIYTKPDLRINTIAYKDGTTYDLVEDPKNEQEELSLVALSHMHSEKKDVHKNYESILRYWKFLDAVKNIAGTSLESILVTHRTKSENILFISGDVADVLHATHMPSSEKFMLQKNLEHLMKKRNKIIAVAHGAQYESTINKHSIHQLQWLGAFSIPLYMHADIDSIHNELTRKNISSVKIFSNENLHTCKAVARAAGIRSSFDACITGSDIRSMSDAEVLSTIPHTTIFSELHEVDKIRLTRLLESTGTHVVHEYGQHATHRI